MTDSPQSNAPRFGPPTTANPFWRIVLVCGALFCVSCLSWIMAGVGDQRVPAWQWLNQEGELLIGFTGLATLGSAMTAMALDRMQTISSENALSPDSRDGEPLSQEIVQGDIDQGDVPG